MMRISKYCKNGGKYVIALLVCAVLFPGCAGKDKALSFTLQEENADGQRGSFGQDDGSLTQEQTAEGDREKAQEESRETKKCCVHVCGAVKSPGVVELPEGSRVQEALLLAGGFTEEAAEDYVNLAAKVTDGQKLYFPTREEAKKLTEDAEAKERRETSSQNECVNINTAGVELLCTLSGIGEARALDIVAYRKQYGAFAAKEDIMKVPGIKQSVYEKICDKITVD